MILFPNSKIFISFGSLQITWYAIFIVTGALCAYFLCQRTMKKWGYASNVLEDYLFPLLIIGIIGARIYYVAFEWSYYSQYPEEIIAIWHGGLAIHGGLIAGFIFSCFYFKHRKIAILRMFDLILPNVFIAQALGRWGNFCNQEAYGHVVSAAYYRYFPAFIKNQMFIDGAYRQPTFLYESIMDLLGFLFIVFIFRKFLYRRRGDAGCMYLIWYGASRFIIEGMRTDSLMVGQFRIAQIVSIVFMVIGFLGMTGLFHRIFGLYAKPVILFDHDGTLVLSKKSIYKTWDVLFQKYRPDHQLTDKEKASFLGPTIQEVFETYFDSKYFDELEKGYIDLNLKFAKDCQEDIPLVKKTIHALHEEGYKLGVVSNKKKILVENELKLAGIYEDMDIILGVDECPKPKPDPSGFVAACDQMHVGHDDLIFVGDSPSDVQAAKNMAAYSIAFSTDMQQKKELIKYRPKRLMHEFSELLNIVKEKRAWCDTKIW